MCGRFSRYTDTRTFSHLLGLDTPNPALHQKYNQPPGLYCLAAASDPHNPESISMQTLFWGFTPSWATQPAQAMINARSETAGTKPYFRKGFAKRRCLVAADNWFEWQRSCTPKQPYALAPQSSEPFFMAGIWSLARSLPDDHPGAGQRTFAILTRPADPQIQDVHHRMPVVLTPAGARAWLEAGEDPADLKTRLEQHRHERFLTWPVSPRVNNPDNDDAAVIDPLLPRDVPAPRVT
ncbi:MAG: DUF159 family protein [Salinisphaeraceae bacterium]|jgi:putative SOS response-associated peptidase YedK|nr:DUF159 family protein [Salinisphaeraceae bacterium]